MGLPAGNNATGPACCCLSVPQAGRACSSQRQGYKSCRKSSEGPSDRLVLKTNSRRGGHPDRKARIYVLFTGSTGCPRARMQPWCRRRWRMRDGGVAPRHLRVARQRLPREGFTQGRAPFASASRSEHPSSGSVACQLAHVTSPAAQLPAVAIGAPVLPLYAPALSACNLVF